VSYAQILGGNAYKHAQGTSICLGVFDGFHLGHQAVANLAEYMVTFDPHPKDILHPKAPVERLSLINEQRYFFNNQLVIPFDLKISKLSPDDFLFKFIAPLSPKKIVVGDDFRYGQHGRGTVNTLKTWGHHHGCEVLDVPIQCHASSTPYKSSVIRKLLKDSPNFAVELLGHPYLLIGRVIDGEKRGAKLGFPTANLKVPANKCVPKFGVYASDCIIKKKMYPSITYIGKKPTFRSEGTAIETYVMGGFSDDIYGKEIKVLLNRYIRSEIVFSDADDLKNQIQSDIMVCEKMSFTRTSLNDF
jgi:riboflavin kinase/FMN adenylyltransferase